jgi:hypothetical protein
MEPGTGAGKPLREPTARVAAGHAGLPRFAREGPLQVIAIPDRYSDRISRAADPRVHAALHKIKTITANLGTLNKGQAVRVAE